MASFKCHLFYLFILYVFSVLKDYSNLSIFFFMFYINKTYLFLDNISNMFNFT